MTSAVLIGNYGVGNLGDEALRRFFEQEMPEVAWTVLSARPAQPHELPRLPAGLRSLLTTPWWRTVSAIRHCDAVVFGGGSLFTDIESSFACFLWWLHAAVARWYGKPVFLAYQGIGPFRTARGERFARRVIAGSTYISVRDRQSADRIISWPKSTNVVQTFDPVFSLFYKEKPHVEQKNRLIIIPRHNSGHTFESQFVNLIQKHLYEDVAILLLHADHPKEQAYAKHLQLLFDKCVIVPIDTMENLCKEISLGSKVLSHRYHGALAALARGVPVDVVSQDDEDKLTSLRPGSGLPIDDPRALLQLVEYGRTTLSAALTASGPRQLPG